MLETLPSLTGWTLIDIVGPILLLAALIYGVVWAGRRSKLTRAQNARRDAQTRNLYASGDTVAEGSAAPRKTEDHPRKTEDHPRKTEDQMQRESLGPRGVPGEPSPARMTPQRAKKTPRNLEPGHTA